MLELSRFMARAEEAERAARESACLAERAAYEEIAAVWRRTAAEAVLGVGTGAPAPQERGADSLVYLTGDALRQVSARGTTEQRSSAA